MVKISDQTAPRSAQSTYDIEVGAALRNNVNIAAMGGIPSPLSTDARLDAFLHPQDAASLTKGFSNASDIQGAFDTVNHDAHDKAAIAKYVGSMMDGAGHLNEEDLVTDKLMVGDVSQAITQALRGAGVSDADIEQALKDKLQGNDKNASVPVRSDSASSV